MPLTHAKIWKGLDALAKREGISPSALARRAGLDPTSFNPSKRFGPGDPPRPRWPSTESVMRVLTASDTSLAEFAAMADDAKDQSLPLLGLAKAGEMGFFSDDGLPLAEGWERTALPSLREGLFSLEIDGDSMHPLYRPGDKVIVDLLDTRVRSGDRVAVRTLSGETLAKELGPTTSRHVQLISLNTAYPPRTLLRADIQWMARIVWVSQ
ncbi:S24 family peptidase [Brevundimonas pishanensis]|uniref:S24 family peptidase n=1 Tax=Brevundimonas pishanensis TaxID=2896315 RepID=UPI001FA6F0C3|nr:helix-turn-helix transcriptional regulator [Brevundimonas pishanensis]